MNERTRNNYITILLVFLWICIGLAMASCAGKGLQIEYTDDEGKEVSILTDYQVENGFFMKRGSDGYEIELGSATTKDADVAVINQMLQMMQSMWMQSMGIPAPVPVTPPEE